MIRIKELFDNPLQYTKTDDNSEYITWEFEINDNEYGAQLIHISNTYNKFDQEKLERMVEDHVGHPIESMSEKGLSLGGEFLFFLFEEHMAGPMPKYDPTGTGNAYQIFSTVLEILKEEVVRDLQVGYFIFRGDDEAHQKLYSNAHRILPKEIPEIEYVDSFSQHEGISHLFINPTNL